MTSHSPQFLLADSHAAAAMITELMNHYPLREEPVTEQRKLYFDSFDWRIYARGLVLKLETDGIGRRLVLSELQGIGIHESQTLVGETLKFAKDLPIGRIREQVSPLLEMRALLPQVEIKSSIRTFCLLDGEEKTVLRLVIEESGSRPPGKGSLKPLTARLHLLPVRGYIKPLQRVERYVSNKLELQRINDTELEEALQPRRRVLGALPVVAVGEEHHQPAVASPLGLAGAQELVHDDLRTGSSSRRVTGSSRTQEKLAPVARDFITVRSAAFSGFEPKRTSDVLSSMSAAPRAATQGILRRSRPSAPLAIRPARPLRPEALCRRPPPGRRQKPCCSHPAKYDRPVPGHPE